MKIRLRYPVYFIALFAAFQCGQAYHEYRLDTALPSYEGLEIRVIGPSYADASNIVKHFYSVED
jgi:hypothetical protein